MSKRCAKCDKMVYPLEELKCLDKVWHKGCFRCWECNMALNMKTYKGFDKKPYCNAHYPTTKFTPVAETPEMARLAQNTKMQSQVKYHEEFEKNIKGTKIQVTDDPETQRIKATTAVISQVEYKKLREKVQEMEEQREKIPKNASSHDQKEAYSEQQGPTSHYDPSRVGGVSMTPNEAVPSPLSSKNQGHSIVYNSKGKVEQSQGRRIGSIHDYDPLNEQHGSLTAGYKPSSSLSQSAQWEETTPAPQSQNHAPPQAHVPLPAPNLPDSEPPAQQEPAPPAPPAEQPDTLPDQHYPPPQHGMPAQQMSTPMAPAQPPPPQPEPTPPTAVPAAAPTAAPAGSANVLSGPVYQAMYDYEAQDDDEIGFEEGDIIINCQAIDEGWMFGTCRRTGQRGMLPANYVERIQ